MKIFSSTSLPSDLMKVTSLLVLLPHLHHLLGVQEPLPQLSALLLYLLVSKPQPLSLVTSKVDVALLAAPPRLNSDGQMSSFYTQF